MAKHVPTSADFIARSSRKIQNTLKHRIHTPRASPARKGPLEGLTMRVREDPRGAAELFCGQHGITDAKTIDLLGETLAELHNSSPSSPPSSMHRPSSLTSQYSTQPSPPPLEAEESTWGAPRRGNGGVDEGAASTRGGRSGEQAGRDAEEAVEGALAGTRVEEIARKMRATAEASHDPADPASVFVDLLVNGDPAPLVFRIPPKKAPHRQPRLSDGGVSELQGETGQPQQGREGEEKEEWGMEDAWEEEEENKKEEIAAAAAAWCREFGANRPEEIAFVETEIEKAVESAAEAAEASAAVRPAAATAGVNGRYHAPTAASGAREEGHSAAVSGARELLQRKESELSDKDGVRPKRSDLEDSSSRGKMRRGTVEERLTLSSVLAPDVEKGTSIFWVKVAWKLLDAYPAQMEAARRDGTLLPARVTLRHAACQREVAFVLIVAVLWVARSRRWWLFKRATPAPADYRRRKKGTPLILSRAYRLLARAWGRTRGKNTRGRRTVIPSPGGCKVETPPVCHDRGDVRTGFVGRYFFGRVLRTARGKNVTAARAEVDGDGPASSAAPTIAAKRAPRKGTITPTETAVDTTTAPDVNNDHRSSSYKNDDDDDGDVNGSGESLPGNGWSSSWAEAALFEAGRVAGTFVRVGVIRPLAYFSGRGTKPHTPALPSRTKSKPVSAKSRRRNVIGSNPRRTGIVAPKRPRIDAKECGKTQEKPADIREPLAGFPADVNAQRTFEGADACRMPPSSVAAVKQNQYVPPGCMAGTGRDKAEEVAAKTDSVPGSGSWTSVLDGLSRDPGNRFMQAAVLSSVGKVLAKTDSFEIETHEACDWVRLFKSKKARPQQHHLLAYLWAARAAGHMYQGDITVGGRKLMVLSRQEGSIILSNKALGSKMIGLKGRSGTVVLGTYTDLSKLEARESVTWLADALASAPVR
ncbi:expressed unknown protein [Ectocarpus siliculosus]|uniref:Profilin n=1 Tax=Ectocarpus siliculosus TaxID=2880 RepID=D7G977_ECTSI|nr:expressed unknown protein [Ectocarpus siliculosus]|eukprot:CBJ28204.1 expressed unknown protein [Ectocarpus siliculosus]